MLQIMSIGGVLAQLDDNGREKPILYASRVLTDTESKYSAFEREALRVIFALMKFRHYLISSKFKLYTIHQALKYIFNMKDPHGQIACWFNLLAEFSFEICYRAGKNDGSADYLSRPVGINLFMSSAHMGSDLKVIANFLNDFASTPQVRTLVKS